LGIFHYIVEKLKKKDLKDKTSKGIPAFST